MPVSFERRGPIGIVTLSRPEARNAWGADFNDGIARNFAAMEDDDEVRCAVLTGDDAGGAFSAGANLKNPRTHTMESAADFIKSIAKRRGRAFEVLGNFPKPIVGAVNGYAVGIGCIVTFCCDLLVASERAEWRLPAGEPRHLAGLRRQHAARALGGEGPRDASGDGLPAHGAGGAPHRARAVAGSARQADGPGAGGGRPHRVFAAARRAPDEGIPADRSGHPQSVGRIAGGSLPVRDPRAHRGQGRGTQAWREKRKPAFRGR